MKFDHIKEMPADVLNKSQRQINTDVFNRINALDVKTPILRIELETARKARNLQEALKRAAEDDLIFERPGYKLEFHRKRKERGRPEFYMYVGFVKE